jgi:hypothetical protein
MWTVAGVEPVGVPKVAREHKPPEVLGREPPSNGHLSIRDWRTMEIIVNTEGP